MQIIHNENKYVSSSVVEQCFSRGKHQKVDKVVCGNGFSTGFLMLDVPVGYHNIIIAPNRGVVLGKEEAYKKGVLNTPSRIGFIYEGSEDRVDFDKFDVIMFVSDSFVHSYKSFVEDILVDKILIDESHTIETDASYRWALVNFDDHFDIFLRNGASVASVTASPNKFSDITTRIDNALVPVQVVHYTNSKESSIARCRKMISEGEKVLVCTNNSGVVYGLRDNNNRIRANFKVGKSLLGALCGMVEVVEDVESDLIIVSSSAFEGFDILGEGWNVFFFEDRSNEFETFNMARFYQAMSRPRAGAVWIEYSQNRRLERRGMVREDTIDRFVASKKLTVEKKQRKKYKKYSKYCVFYPSGVSFVIGKNVALFNNLKEQMLYDKGFDEFKEFLDDRNITIIDLDEMQDKRKPYRIGMDKMIANLTKNKKVILRHDLFAPDTQFVKFYGGEWVGQKGLHNNVEKFFVKKSFAEKDVLRRPFSANEEKCLWYLSDGKRIDELIGRVTKAYRVEAMRKYGQREGRERVAGFITRSQNVVREVIITFAHEKVFTPGNYIAHRNYDIFTTINVSAIKVIADEFNVEVLELDIVSAFARIVYARCGRVLPDGFYGANKEKKYKINVLLNNFFYREELKTSKKQQKQNAIVAFRRYNFDEEVIKYLIDNYFDIGDRGAVFNSCAFHERQIIKQIRREFLEDENSIRRHDSALVFNPKKVDIKGLKAFKYLGISGWF